MAKHIAYLIVDNGIDGREPDRIVEAHWDEGERDRAFAQNKNKAYYHKSESIVDVDKATSAAIAKLNGLDRLLLAGVLGVPV
jgi:hypothetical protein